VTAKILPEAGLNNAIVEAGTYFDPADWNTQTKLKISWDSQRRKVTTKILSNGAQDIAFIAGI